MSRLYFIDLFCGCGGFSLGMERAGLGSLAASGARRRIRWSRCSSGSCKGSQASVRLRGPPRVIRLELKPLGLKWRAANVVSLAHEIERRFQGRVPSGKVELLSLPGVGPYVAGAVRCFALGKSEPLIDTNVVRVIGRFFGLRLEGEARRRKEMIATVEACVPRRRPADYNYALLDVAAAVCLARKPLCGKCPLKTKCDYYQRLARGVHADCS